MLETIKAASEIASGARITDSDAGVLRLAALGLGVVERGALSLEGQYILRLPNADAAWPTANGWYYVADGTGVRVCNALDVRNLYGIRAGVYLLPDAWQQLNEM